MKIEIPLFIDEIAQLDESGETVSISQVIDKPEEENLEFNETFLHSLDRIMISSEIDNYDSSLQTEYLFLEIDGKTEEYIPRRLECDEINSKCNLTGELLFEKANEVIINAMKKTDLIDKIKKYENELK